MTQARVLQLIDGLNYGGAEVLLRDLSVGLLRRGFHVSVGYSTPGPLAAEMASAGIEIRHLPRLNRVDPVLLVGMLRMIRSLRPHVVHTHLFKSDIHGRLAAWMAGVPIVISTLHNADDWAQRWPLGWLYGATATFSDGLIAVSEEVRQYHITNTWIPASKVVTIENGVDRNRFVDKRSAGLKLRAEFNIEPDSILFGLIGRLKPQKDHATFLRAAAQVLQKFPSARFLVVGDGPLRPEVEQQASELGLLPALIFAGLRTDIPAVMAALDVLVFSSRWEGLPVTLLEGMASALPVAATNVDGIRAVALHESTALLVPPGNPSALADACLRLAADAGLRSRLGQAGLVRVSMNYSLDGMIDRTVDFYKGFLRARGLGDSIPVAAEAKKNPSKPWLGAF